jgi:hypothetical protein
MDPQRFFDDRGHSHRRIEGGQRVLKHQLHVAALSLAAAFRHRGDVITENADTATSRREQAKQRARQTAFS